jgi:uncharacterized protein (DUF1684 family)
LKNNLALFFFLLGLLACQTKEQSVSEQYQTDFDTYQQKLNQGRDHYLKLIGLFPLDSGIYTFGGSSGNTIEIRSDSIPDTIGSIEIDERSISFSAIESIAIKTVATDSVITSWQYDFTKQENSKLLKWNHLEWMVIKREAAYFLRVKDHNSDLAKNFKGFERFPLLEKYLVKATYTPYEEQKTEFVAAQKGPDQSMNFAGVLRFELGGQQHELSVGGSGFLIVGDQTNDVTTYGGGRYMYVTLPEDAGTVTIDFNKLYNPPCVYSEFTTCPLPPAQNQMNIQLMAGEKSKRL